MFHSFFLEIPSGCASVAALIVGAICAALTPEREVRIVLAVGAFAVIPGLAWSVSTITTLVKTGVSDASPPFAGILYLWMCVGGLGLTAIVVDRPQALRTGVSLRWALGLYSVAWLLAAVNGFVASAGI